MVIETKQELPSVTMNHSELIKTLNDAAAQSVSTLGEDERATLLRACENLKATLESPLEATVRFMFGVYLTDFSHRFLAIMCMGWLILAGSSSVDVEDRCLLKTLRCRRPSRER